MENVKVYRADDYHHNMGDIIGFFTSKEEAERQLEYSKQVSLSVAAFSQITDFSQITEFEIPESKLEDVEFSDTKRMLEEDIWGSGEIINDYYYL